MLLRDKRIDDTHDGLLVFFGHVFEGLEASDRRMLERLDPSVLLPVSR